MSDVLMLLGQARIAYEDWTHQCRGSYGRVVSYENKESVVVGLRWREDFIKVVYNPQLGVLRTVLPRESTGQWNGTSS